MYTDLGAELKRVRRLRQFSVRAFAYCCGVSKSTVRYVEEGKLRGSKALWRRFSYLLDWEFDIPDDLMENGKIKLRPLRELPTPWGAAMLPYRELKKWEFIEGVKYTIDKVNYVFLRKEGIHHIFRRAASGCKWLTSYTDSQLVDAVVKN